MPSPGNIRKSLSKGRTLGLATPPRSQTRRRNGTPNGTPGLPISARSSPGAADPGELNNAVRRLSALGIASWPKSNRSFTRKLNRAKSLERTLGRLEPLVKETSPVASKFRTARKLANTISKQHF
jgi:hypothetical protein